MLGSDASSLKVGRLKPQSRTPQASKSDASSLKVASSRNEPTVPPDGKHFGVLLTIMSHEESQTGENGEQRKRHASEDENGPKERVLLGILPSPKRNLVL
ncbi:hypothetical protein L596_023879 [Steinernema carpocapsae]|uniref:Uncharacterized protein n=1 Tax=Steinernema carpocapsae TaxID=34508 RepID=A0A4U5MFR5_STECR|nr:hypothetical protein L596_023879 [Steinernema carpocapsae]